MPGVGRTSVLFRFCDDMFSDVPIPTISTDFRFKKMELHSKAIKVQVWDHAGRADLQALMRSWYRNFHVTLAIFSVSDLQSFEYLADHLTETGQYRSEKSLLVVVANKIDVPSSLRVVTSEMGRAFAESRGCVYYEVSAKTGENIDAMFQDLVYRVLADRFTDSSTSTPTPATNSCILQ
eukprot:TRINITY_DN6973_c0_g1_i1.p1 TRINITY_DN6973_c0_g1~~TRINITY_DN6973_c0_g1_i1.p1  ORF type:complete len:179 (+),score=34.64 TRINITY_DN6973_c0_g1_i1:227-763(+)